VLQLLMNQAKPAYGPCLSPAGECGASCLVNLMTIIIIMMVVMVVMVLGVAA